MPKNETLYGKDSNADKKEKDTKRKTSGNRPVLKSNFAVGWLNFSKKDGNPYLNIQTALGEFAMFFQREEIDRMMRALEKAKEATNEQ